MDIKKKILIIYGQMKDLSSFRRRLNSDNYEVLITSSGTDGIQIAQSHCPELILLGVRLDDMDGFSVLRAVRSWCGVPVIMLSADDKERDVLEALDGGADDFIQLPCSVGQFMSRVNVAMRHYAPVHSEPVSPGSFRMGKLVVDYAEFRAYVDGSDADLTHNEFRIVSLLSRNAGSICTYEYLISQLWGPNASTDNQSLRVHMANIRKKLESGGSAPRYIKTISGVGYRMSEK